MGVKVEPPPPTVIEVCPLAWPVVRMFFRCDWQISQGQYLAINKASLLGPGQMFELYEVEDHRQMLEDLLVMQVAALNVLHGGNK